MPDIRVDLSDDPTAEKLILTSTSGLEVGADPYLLSDGLSLMGPLPTEISPVPILRFGALLPPVDASELGGTSGPSLPADAIVLFSPVEADGWSPALPLASGGYRSLGRVSYVNNVGVHLPYLASALRAPAMPVNSINIMFALQSASTANDWWTGDYQVFTLNGYGSYFATRAQRAGGDILSQAMTPQADYTDDFRFFELFNNGTEVSYLLDETYAAQREAATPFTSFTRVSFPIEDSALSSLDVVAMVGMPRLPTSEERAQIAAWIAAFVDAPQPDAIVAPAGFTMAVPYPIHRTDEGFEVTFNPRSRMLHALAFYYVDPVLGNDANSGVASAPKRTLAGAITAANANGMTATIYLASGEYGQAGTGAQVVATVDLNLICLGEQPAILGQTTVETGWTQTVAPNTNLWQKTVVGAAPVWVFDYANLDSDGNPRALFRRSVAQAHATRESCAAAGQIVYVNTFDGRQPDGDIRVVRAGLGLDFGNSAVYMENVWYFGAHGEILRSIPNVPNPRTLHRCRFGYAFENDVTSLDNVGLIVVSESFAVWGHRNDGWNYHSATAGTGETMEIDVVGRHNGNGNTSQLNNNGSTSHDGRKIIRVNGRYTDNYNRNIHDVGDGHQTWMLGCEASRAEYTALPTQFDNGNFAWSRDAATEVCRAWLDSCTTEHGALFDLWSGGVSFVYTHNMDLTGWITGGTGTRGTY